MTSRLGVLAISVLTGIFLGLLISDIATDPADAIRLLIVLMVTVCADVLCFILAPKRPPWAMLPGGGFVAFWRFRDVPKR